MSRTRSTFAAINPMGAMFGPLFQKEVRASGRKRSTYVLRALYCLGLLAILAGAFLVYGSGSNARSAAERLQAMQKLAPTLTLVVSWFQFGVLFLAAPVLAAGSLCDERRARSLDVLMTTPLAASQIVVGKVSSRIAQVVILALLATPALLAVRVFGGLNAEVILATSCLAVSTAVLGAALAVMFSMRQKRATIAALFGLLALALLQGGPSVVEGIRFYAANEWVVESPYRRNVLATCSPAVLALLSETAYAGESLPRVQLGGPVPAAGAGGPAPAASPIDLGPMWAINTGYNIFLAALATVYTTLSLRRAMKRTSRLEGLLSGAAPTRQRMSDKEPMTVDRASPGPDAESGRERFRERSRSVADNPVLWREVRLPLFGSRRLFRIVAVLTAVAMGILYWQVGLSHPGLHAALAYVGCAAVVFQAVFLTSGPFAGEREARTWDVLLTTTLSPRQILLGKALGTLRSFWFIPAVVIVDFAVAAAMGFVRPIAVLYLVLIYSGPALLLSAAGLMFSLRFTRSVTAGALNLAVAAGLWVFLWLTPLILPMMLRVLLAIPSALGMINTDLVVDRMLDDYLIRVIDAIYAINPFALIDAAISPCVLDSGPRGTVKPPFEAVLIRNRMNMAECSGVVAAVFAFYVLVAAGILGLARLRFKEWSGRVS